MNNFAKIVLFGSLACQSIFAASGSTMVESMMFTNGIGTIYFDAVNSCATNSPFFRLKVEVSTNAFDGASERDVTWKEIPAIRMEVNGTNIVSVTTNTEVSLQITVGGRMDRFYRIVAPVNICEPCRMRIRRTGFFPGCDADDPKSYILMDNIICTPPTTMAELKIIRK